MPQEHPFAPFFLLFSSKLDSKPSPLLFESVGGLTSATFEIFTFTKEEILQRVDCHY